MTVGCNTSRGAPLESLSVHGATITGLRAGDTQPIAA